MNEAERLAQAFDTLDKLMLLIPGVDAAEVAAHIRKQAAVLKQALNALEHHQRAPHPFGHLEITQDAITAIKELSK